jgi:hypothetical protein
MVLATSLCIEQIYIKITHNPHICAMRPPLHYKKHQILIEFSDYLRIIDYICRNV